MADLTELVASYVSHRAKHGKWPKPGSYKSGHLIYIGTESSSPEFPGRRTDLYRTLFDGGRELDIIMYQDGRIEAKVPWPAVRGSLNPSVQTDAASQSDGRDE